MFDDHFIDGLPNDPLEAVRTFLVGYSEFQSRIENEDHREDSIYDLYLLAFGIAQGMAEANEIEIDKPDLTEDRMLNLSRIRDYIKWLRSKVDFQYGSISVTRGRERLRNKFGKSFHYEFSAGDINKAQKLINEIRDLISNNASFEEDHRKRLLARLEKLQAELHKKISNLDVFWGLIGDAGVVLGKFGNDVKPLFERIRELTMIVWATQSRAEGLPSDYPSPLQLPPPDPSSEVPGISIDV